MARWSYTALLASMLVSGSALAQSAQQEHRYPWTYHRFDAIDYGVTAAATVGVAFAQFGLDPPREAGWSSTWGPDASVRDWFRADSVEGRRRADVVSDALWIGTMSLPFVDLAFPLFGDRWNTDTAWQMTAINFEAMALSGFVSRTGHRLAARERPDVQECRADPDYSDGCFSGSYSGFPSGHTSAASAGAGLTCAHHLRLGLLGEPIADGLVCGLAATAAVGTGVTRMMADRHYVTDVVAGAAIGFGAGLVLPLLRHYREAGEGTARATGIRWTLAPSTPGRDGVGVAALGWF